MADRHQVSLHPNREVTDADIRAGDTARQLHSMLQTIATSAVESGAENRVHAILILAQAANGLVHMLARTVMPDAESKDPISSTATLFAALLAYHTAPCEHTVGNVRAEYSPLIIYDALKDVERLSGQQPDERLNEQMCRVARKCASDPEMIRAINKGRSVVLRDGSPLN